MQKRGNTKTLDSISIREVMFSREDYGYPLFRAVVTTTAGYCWQTTYADDKPTEEKVQRDWEEDRGRKNFLPHYS